MWPLAVITGACCLGAAYLQGKIAQSESDLPMMKRMAHRIRNEAMPWIQYHGTRVYQGQRVTIKRTGEKVMLAGKELIVQDKRGKLVVFHPYVGKDGVGRLGKCKVLREASLLHRLFG